MISNNKTKKKKRKRPIRKNISGTLMKAKKGYGFVVPEAEGARDIFVSKSNLNGAMHGDTVEVNVYSRNLMSTSTSGKIMKIVKRATKELIGSFKANEEHGLVIPYNRKLYEDIFISKKNSCGAQSGDKVVVQIVKYPDDESGAEGRITEIISGCGDPDRDIKALVRQSGLKETFPAQVEEEVERIVRQTIDIDKRTDLREKVIFTIDGADAKDLDDAVSIEKNENGNYILGVHIADVSAYVVEDRATDKEAHKRGNSVYLVGMVIPMLPKALSNGLCSLNQGEDRLTLSVDMEINAAGTLVSHRIYESVIHSCARLVYTDVSDMLENRDEALIEKYDGIYPSLLLMEELARLLKKKRDENGSIDFGLNESEIEMDENGGVKSVSVAERRTANKIIEEFMLAANETIAEHFFLLDTPFVYRVHEKPGVENIENFKAFIKNFGLNLEGNPKDINPRVLADILRQTAGKPYECVVNTVMLKSMRKAFYSTDCEGHFGLGFKHYCHFTSPIRRYPDLMIHRIIKETLETPLEKSRKKALKKKTIVAAEISSMTEIKALELEREAEKMKKAEYMVGCIGEVFEGVISGVTSYGLYVELPNTIEGMIRIDSLEDDFYEYEPQKYRIIGRMRNKIFALGDKINIIVKSADPLDRQIDFSLKKQ